MSHSAIADIYSTADFQTHCNLYLNVMPSRYFWSTQHTTTTRSTINRYLIPAFGALKVCAIGDESINKLSNSLAQENLSTHRINNIIRMAKKIAACNEIYGVDAHLPVIASDRATIDANKWLSHYKEFARYWKENPQTTISDQLSFATWVYKQRHRFNTGKMSPKQITLLQRINFPFVAVSAIAPTTNMQHAHALVKLYKETGLYAPTDTFGGSALTKWITSMRKSNCTVGLKSATDSPAEAFNYITKHIPEFSWEFTQKATVNESFGLSHNGYPEASYSKKREVQRIAQVMNAPRPSFKGIDSSAQMQKSMIDFLIMIRNSKAPLLINDVNGSAGWLDSVVKTSENSYDFKSLTADGLNFSCTDVTKIKFHLGDDFDNGYLKADLFSTRDHLLVGHLTLDWIVMEQRVGREHSIPEDWKQLPQGVKYLSPQTTRFVSFISNIKRLAFFCQKGAGTTNNHIGWDTHHRLYKYIEHCRRKFHRGNLGLLELFLLTLFKATIGGPKALPLSQWVQSPMDETVSRHRHYPFARW